MVDLEVQPETEALEKQSVLLASSQAQLGEAVERLHNLNGKGDPLRRSIKQKLKKLVERPNGIQSR